MSEDEPAAKCLVPLFHIFHGVYYMGAEVAAGAAFLQLPTDEGTERRQTDDRCMASACNRCMGEDLRQASDAEAIGSAGASDTGEHRARRMDS